MSVPVASFQLNATSGAYTFVISSCNPQQPVSFQIGGQRYDPKRLGAGGNLGGRFPSLSTINVFPSVPTPTVHEQNPVKLVVSAITSDTGEFIGNTAIFYGYFLQPNAGGLGFYLNEAQSQKNFQYGATGILANIGSGFTPYITLG
jgi:hypothetical protein